MIRLAERFIRGTHSAPPNMPPDTDGDYDMKDANELEVGKHILAEESSRRRRETVESANQRAIREAHSQAERIQGQYRGPTRPNVSCPNHFIHTRGI